MKSSARDGGLPNAARYADAGRTLKKRRPREGAVKSDVPVVLLLVENAHRRIEDRGVVQRHDSAVGTLFHMDADISFGIVMLPAEIVADGVYIDSAIRCELPLGSLSLIRRNSLNVITIAL